MRAFAKPIAIANVVVSTTHAGERLDRLLATQIPGMSRARLKALILDGAVEIGARPIRDPGEIVSSLVEDIIMPPLGKVIGGVNFTDLALSLGPDPAGKEVLWKYGNFLQISFQFLIVAFVLFMLIRTINKLKKPDPAAPPPPTPRQEVLLQEIRDLLAKK